MEKDDEFYDEMKCSSDKEVLKCLNPGGSFSHYHYILKKYRKNPALINCLKIQLQRQKTGTNNFDN